MSPEDHIKIKNILLNLADDVIKVDITHGNISKIIKQLDFSTQSAYISLYKIIDGREVLKQRQDAKSGHCC